MEEVVLLVDVCIDGEPICSGALSLGVHMHSALNIPALVNSRHLPSHGAWELEFQFWRKTDNKMISGKLSRGAKTSALSAPALSGEDEMFHAIERKPGFRMLGFDWNDNFEVQPSTAFQKVASGERQQYSFPKELGIDADIAWHNANWWKWVLIQPNFWVNVHTPVLFERSVRVPPCVCSCSWAGPGEDLRQCCARCDQREMQLLEQDLVAKNTE
jgi:hypothetical protein